MFNIISALAGPLISGVSGYFTKKQEAKTAKATGEAKLALKKQTGDENITLTDAEWENLTAKTLGGSWKDEFVTLVILSPVISIMVGAVWNSFTGNRKLLDGTLEGIDALINLGLNWELLTTAVVLAAIGLKVWRSK